MLDLVFAQNLPNARGIGKAALALALPNFKMPKSAGEATAFSRMRNAIVYSPSYEFDDGVFKDLAKGRGAVAFAFSDLLRESGFRRAILISKMRLAFASCRKAGCGFFVCSLAREGDGLRNGAELLSFGAVLGMNPHEVRFADETIARLAEKETKAGSGSGKVRG